MTARELIKALESCDIDKPVSILVSIIGENDDGYNVLLREIRDVVEEDQVIGLT